MPWWLVLAGLVGALLAGWLVLTWLLGEAEGADPRAALRIEAIRTSLTVVAGAGGAVALLLAARRQWINERAQRHHETVAAREHRHRERSQTHLEAVAEAGQRHQERQAQAAEHDATERRVTDLYTTAVNLLGSDRAAIRTAGLFALERLAQDHPGHRQTIVDVICAYLRMPDSADDPREAQVRASAQTLLVRHLRPAAEPLFWHGIHLDLAGARLVDVDLSGTDLAAADFTRTVFSGPADFSGMAVYGALRLSGATFARASFDRLWVLGDASVDAATFTGPVSLAAAELTGAATFAQATFADSVSFTGGSFGRPATFDRVRFGGDAGFADARFAAGVSIEHSTFDGGADFRRAHFADMALLRWSVFHGEARFDQAVFEGALNLARVEFHQAALFDGATLHRTPQLDRTRAAAGAAHSWPAGLHTKRADDNWLSVVNDTSRAAGDS